MSTLATTNLKHASSGSNNIVLDSSGRALVGLSSANANGGILQLSSGITFPATQVLSTDPNTLDDYEEGTFSPTVVGTSTAGTATYAVRYGGYTKIGRLVHIIIYLEWGSGTGSGNLRIGNLPFTCDAWTALSLAYVDLLSLSANNIATANLGAPSTEIRLIQTPVGGGAISFVPYDAAANLMIAGSYIV